MSSHRSRHLSSRTSTQSACLPSPKPLAAALHQAMLCLAVGSGAMSINAAAQTSTDKAPETTLPAVTVSAVAASDSTDLPAAYAGGQTARGGRLGMLGNRGSLDTPFSTTSYTAQRIEDQQAVTLADVLNADPSIRFTGQTGGVTDSFMIRGFPINEGNLSEVAFDGVYGVSPNYHLFPEYMERVEVLKGPAAMLYGMSPNSGVGGVVNLVPKRAGATDLTRFTLDYASDAQVGGAVDLSRRWGDDKEWGVRFNGLHRQGPTPLDNQKSRSEVAAVSLDYHGDRLRASLDLIEQYQWIDAPTRPFLVAPGIEVPAAPDGRRNVTQPWGWWKSNDVSTLLRVEYDVADNVTVYADAGGTRSDVSRLSDQTPTILNAAGDTSAAVQNWRFQINRMSFDTGVRAKFDTGPVKHALALQANLYSDRIANANVAGTPVRSNIYNPVVSPEQSIAPPSFVPKVSDSTLSGVALVDTVSTMDDRVALTLGLRYQQVESNNYNTATGAKSSSYDENAVTPLAGIVFRPWRNVSFYANYVEGLSKGDIAPATASNAGQVFAPYKTKQQEVGVKVDAGSIMATLAAFRMTKPSGQLFGTVYAVDSEQRNQGLELTVSGEVMRRVRLLGGITWLDGKLTKTNSAATQGNRPVGVPDFMANLGAEWDLPWLQGLTLTGALNYTGRTDVNQANTQSVPSWTTVDVGARYRTKVSGKTTTFRATVINAFDKHYWSGVASYSTISQGAPRTFLGSVTVDF
ncbi:MULTISPECIES: TonB-dependent receptor [Cupriavidus]|jgi:iron complex outermembrane recepter protein|uniref:TonB-dependent siderophore receptor n=1 Tax=Cupriavidus metallidurans TaxID=119219 RepID=A0A2L0X155_9BURK|nr:MULTISPECIES: TonB-dependent siderophore receptor [Cupriavidus]AVA33811.1 TonB-dependent siderophore receptor [Cupriavidus metallidurans]QBP12499.1 TonB-dependent siderophore receptor [Cupriavidus metallidurans]